MLAPVGERWLGWAALARPRALGMDPEKGVPSTGQDQGSNRGGWRGPIYREPGSQYHEPVPVTTTSAATATASWSISKKAAGVVSSRTKLVRVKHFTGSDQKTNWGQGVLSRGKGDVLTNDPRYFISWCSCFTSLLENTSPVWWITTTRVEGRDKDTGKKQNWKQCCNAIGYLDRTRLKLPVGWKLIHCYIVLRHDSSVRNHSVGKLTYYTCISK